jgi:hypothetical protein
MRFRSARRTQVRACARWALNMAGAAEEHINRALQLEHSSVILGPGSIIKLAANRWAPRGRRAD